MTKNQLKGEYFEWIVRLVQGSKRTGRSSYRKLLKRLDSIDFTYTIDMDGNRADDGVGLRYRFGYETEREQSIIAAYLDNRPCSVLEMMAALALRCEEHIMDDPDAGNRTGRWFWGMMESLGLMGLHDLKFDKEYTDGGIFRFLNREYEPDGRGGLFTVTGCGDLRNVEIWYQMCWYLNDILRVGG